MAKTLEQKINAHELALARLKERARAADTRQKIVVGAAVISRALQSPETARHILEALNATPPREHDRKLLEALVSKLEQISLTLYR